MISARREQRRFAAAFGLLSTPMLAYAYLAMIAPERDSLVMVPLHHFYIVSAASLTALALAIVVGIASVRSREPRTFLVSAGFLAVAGVFAVHGLSTPGEQMIVKELHHSLLISARLSLFLGSICFVLSSYDLPRRVQGFIARRHGSLMIAAVAVIAIYIGANLAKPDLLDVLPTGTATRQAPSDHAHDTPAQTGYSAGYRYGAGAAPEPSAPTVLVSSPAEQLGRFLGHGMAVVATLFFAVAGWRFYKTYAISRTPATGALAAGLVLLAEAQVIMALGAVWHLSWWTYHVAMLLGFLIPVGAIGWSYRRGSSLSEIVDGLFVRDAFARVERSFPEAIGDLITVIEKRDPYLRGHMRRVGELTVRIAEAMELPAETARAASHAALLHDVGKLGMPETILHKPGKLTADEFDVLKTHPERGYQMVIQAPALLAAAPAVRWHHERLDGTGYPDRLRSHAIPVEARIVAVADMWDALTSDRVYRSALSPEAARAIMLAESGTKLDGHCVQALLTVLDRAEQPVAALPYRPTPRPADRPLPSFLAS